jgi:hypothetical protein
MTTQPNIRVMTWDPVCERSVTMARRIGRPLETIHYLWYRRPWITPLKYPLQAGKTFAWLQAHRPAVTVVSNPPPFAALCVWLYCAVTGSAYVVDAHTGVFLESKWRPFLPLNRFLMRRARLTLVTNEALRQQVEAWKARAFVLPDALPDLTGKEGVFPLDATRFNVAAVFSFYEDEPVEEMLAVADLPADMRVYVTGDHRRVPGVRRRQLSPQLTLTGFLPRASYEALLRHCDAVVVLCTKPHTLLCGAYEAVAAAKPLLTSESEAMRAYFRKGTVFVANTATGIEAGLRELRRRHGELSLEMRALRADLRVSWEHTFTQCLDAIVREPGEMRVAA